jgi:hypothetical protein
MIIYLAGPVSGYPDGNRPAFEALRRRILAVLTEGVEVVIPQELYTPQGEALRCPALRWCEAMLACLPVVERAAIVFMVQGWEGSPGARREQEHAQAQGIAVGEWLA